MFPSRKYAGKRAVDLLAVAGIAGMAAMSACLTAASTLALPAKATEASAPLAAKATAAAANKQTWRMASGQALEMYSKQNYDLAEKLYRQALALIKDDAGASFDTTTDLYLDLASVHLQQNQPDKALALLKSIAGRVTLQSSPMLHVRYLRRLRDTALAQKNTLACDYQSKIVSLIADEFSMHSAEYAVELANQALYLHMSKRFGELQRVLVLLKRLSNSRSHEIAEICHKRLQEMTILLPPAFDPLITHKDFEQARQCLACMDVLGVNPEITLGKWAALTDALLRNHDRTGARQASAEVFARYRALAGKTTKNSRSSYANVCFLISLAPLENMQPEPDTFALIDEAARYVDGMEKEQDLNEDLKVQVRCMHAVALAMRNQPQAAEKVLERAEPSIAMLNRMTDLAPFWHTRKHAIAGAYVQRGDAEGVRRQYKVLSLLLARCPKVSASTKSVRAKQLSEAEKQQLAQITSRR